MASDSRPTEPGKQWAVGKRMARLPIFFSSLLLLLATAPLSRANSVLEEAVERWLGERDHWAFTQRAVEYDDGKPRERLAQLCRECDACDVAIC